MDETAPHREREPEGPIPPLGHAEIRAAFLNPIRAIEIVLADHARFASTLGEPGTRLGLVLLTIVLGSVIALPFGLVLGTHRTFHIALLFAGSTAICMPSLHVFSTYLGFRLDVAQTLGLSALLAAVASVFSFGFAPIVLFLKATFDSAHANDEVAPIATTLLALSLFAGMWQLVRCLRAGSGRFPRRFPALLVAWELLLVFIVHRMATFLELF